MGLQAAATDVLLVGGALALGLLAGVVAHEGAHAVVLRALGIPVEVEWLPDGITARSSLAGGLGHFARVTPRRLPADVPPWGLRLAALAPLALATPMALILLGVLPDPVRAGSTPLLALTVAWFACALPSPRDFAVVWHTEAAIAAHDEPSGTDGR